MQLSKQEWYVLGASAVLFLITGLLLAEAMIPESSPRRENGTWIVEERADRSYHRYHPEAEQVTFIGNIGAYNVSTERYMELGCTDAVRVFLIDHLRQTLPNASLANRTGLTIGYKKPIRLNPSDRGTVDTFRQAAPDQVRCIIHFQGHTYTRTVNITVQYATIEAPVETIDCSKTSLAITDATYTSETNMTAAAITNTGSRPLNVTLAAFQNGDALGATELANTLLVNTTATVNLTVEHEPDRVTAASPDCPAARASMTNITDR